MFPQLARVAWMALLVVWFGCAAHAQEVPSVEVADGATTSALDLEPRLVARTWTRARARWFTGLFLGVAGPATMAAGIVRYTEVCSIFGCAEPAGGWLAAGFVGIASTITGVTLALSSGHAAVRALRHGGIDVSRTLAVASLVVPAVCIVTAVMLGAFAVPVAPLVVLGLGYTSIFALSGAQLALTASKSSAAVALKW